MDNRGVINIMITLVNVLVNFQFFYKGETGLVYKAYLTSSEGTEIVAVKMSKSKLAYSYYYYYYYHCVQ